MRINNNIMAMNAHRQLKVNNVNQEKSLEKLSSGFRINRAGDDAAGLSISEKMRAQIKGLQQASRNSQDAVSLIQTTEGALNEAHAIVQRLRELAVQAANGTNVTSDRSALDGEISQLKNEVNRIADNTDFNTQRTLNSGFNVVFQVGANSGQYISVSFRDMHASGIGILIASVGTIENARQAIALFDGAITIISQERANIGAIQNRLEHTIKNLDIAAENLQAAESRIRDVDMAKEMMEFTKNNILNQASTAMLAQANQAPQSVLQLLK